MPHKNFVYIDHMIRSIRRAALRPSSSDWTRTAYKAGLTSIYQTHCCNHCNIAINKNVSLIGEGSHHPLHGTCGCCHRLCDHLQGICQQHQHHHENSCCVLLLFLDHKNMVFNCISHYFITNAHRWSNWEHCGKTKPWQRRQWSVRTSSKIFTSKSENILTILIHTTIGIFIMTNKTQLRWEPNCSGEVTDSLFFDN